MQQPKVLFLLAISTKLFNTSPKNSSPIRYFNSQTFRYKHKTTFHANFYFIRQITTAFNAEKFGKTLVYQPSSQKSFSDTTTHPSNTTSQHIRNISQIYPAIDDDTQQPPSQDKPSLMILIGWWNCKPKHLLKYVSLYTDKFHTDTLSHIPPFYHVFFPWTIYRDIYRLAKELIEIWIERGKPNNIGFHVFSDNGTYHYAMLCEAVRDLSKNYSENDHKQIISSSSGLNLSRDDAESFLNSIKSCVIDSAPSPISEKYLALGIMGGFLKKTALMKKSTSNSNFEKEEIPIIQLPPFLITVLSIFFSLPVVKRHQDFAHKSLCNIPGGTHDGRRVKYLFLYGPGDQIIPEKDVIEFIERLKERESNHIKNEKKGELTIVTKRFGADSEHVQHFLRYPDEYISALKSFYNI
ncbi:17806_t:CDS:1 [Funneliformis geosporum]|uniref:5414_t:CDS:1 n=1 Tax=Funneliformis geosporum TaxID=1117311 RepID=A0A9W4SPZ5_9GLOM|nr:17806_t:CDS:1 [Funneliformis geosporum]CAI2177050.1 5414_t:CDS:1 [Funneliformis geosporum]